MPTESELRMNDLRGALGTIETMLDDERAGQYPAEYRKAQVELNRGIVEANDGAESRAVAARLAAREEDALLEFAADPVEEHEAAWLLRAGILANSIGASPAELERLAAEGMVRVARAQWRQAVPYAEALRMKGKPSRALDEAIDAAKTADPRYENRRRGLAKAAAAREAYAASWVELTTIRARYNRVIGRHEASAVASIGVKMAEQSRRTAAGETYAGKVDAIGGSR